MSAELAPAPSAAVPAPAGSPGTIWTSRLAAVLVGVAVAALIVVVRNAGWLSGIPGLFAAVVLALAFPTSRLLARRILIAGALAFGAAPLLWFWDLPVGDVGRMTILMAAGAGALSAWLLWGGRAALRSRARLLVPRPRRIDVLPPAAALVAGLATLPWLRVSTGQEALSAVLGGWDNSAHYNIVAMIRRHGVTIDRLADVAPEYWKFTDYPGGFHSFVVAIMELTGSARVATPAHELVAFVQAEAWCLVIVAALLAAAVAALPWVRRMVVAVPVVAGLVAAFALGPGAEAVSAGFPNFVIAVALAACVPLLVASMPRVIMPLHLAALGSLLVAVAESWALMLVIAAPAALMLVVPFRREAWRATRTAWALSILVVLATLGGIIQVASVIAVLDASEVLVTSGGFVAPSPGPAIAICLVAIAVCLLADGRSFGRTAWIGVATAIGLAAVAALGAFQLVTDGQLSYYFWKGLSGVQLVSFAVLGLGATRALRRLDALPRGPGRLASAVTVIACTVAATQVNGVTVPAGLALKPVHAALADDLLAAATVAEAAPDGRWTLVTSLDSSAHPVVAQQWLLALTGRWTHEANAEAEALTTMGREVDDFVQIATEALSQSPDAMVLVPATQADAVRAAIAPDLASRVIGLP